MHVSSDVPGFLYGRDWLGDVRIRGESANPARPLFIGIARKGDVDRYLAGVAHSEVVDVNANPFGTNDRPSYRAQAGGKPAVPPGREKFWVAKVAGRGSLSLAWGVEHGRLGRCRHAADGSRGDPLTSLPAPRCRRSCGHRSACSWPGCSPWAARSR